MTTERKVRILFEASSLQPENKTGVGYFSERFLSSLANDSRLAISCLVFPNNPFKRSSSVNFTGTKKVFFGLPFRIYRALLSREIRLPIRVGRYDFAIFPNFYSLPVRNVRKKIVVVHDLAYKSLPDTLDEKNRAFLDRVVRKTLHEVDGVITVSEFTKNELLRHYPFFDRRKVLAINIPYEKPLRPAGTLCKDDLIQLGVQKKFILFVGTLEPRKNIVKLIEAYRALPAHLKNDYQLVLAGKLGWKSADIEESIHTAIKHGDHVVTTGYITEEQLDCLYDNASLVAMPSKYEGFGMPVVEAISHRKAVIANDIPVFREVGKDACYFADADNPECFSQALEEVITNEALRAKLIKNGAHLTKDMSWSRNIDEIMKWSQNL